MMPVIRISDAAFADLKHIATWLDADTPSKAIDRLVRNEMERLGLERDDQPTPEPTNSASNGTLSFEKAPGLSFTRILSATVASAKFPKINWAGLLLEVIRNVHKKGIEGDSLARKLQIPSKVGIFEENGFKYHPDIGLSIQGQSASDAWREIDRLAEKHRIPVEVEFQWRDNDKAQHPRRTGLIKAGF